MAVSRGWILAAVVAAAAPRTVAAAGPSPSGTDPAAPAIYQFGEIVVTGDLPRVVDTVTGVDVVTADDIERAGARTVDEAIDLLPGVHVRRGAQGVPLIDIRGLRTRNVLLLLDGVPLNSSFDGLFDPATLSVENIARIKLTRGPSSMLYGPGGNGGVLNIVTRAAGEAPEAAARLEAGSAGSRDLRARASWRGERLGLVVTGSFFDQDSFQLSGDFEPTPLEDGGERLNSDRRGASAFVSLTFDGAPGTRLGFNLDYRDTARGKPPGTEDPRSSPFAPRLFFERADEEALSAHAALSHEIGEWTLRPALFLNRTDEATDAFDDASFASQRAPGAFHEEAVTRTAGTAVQAARRTGGGGLLTLAVDLRQESWRAEGFAIAAGDGGGGGGGGTGPAGGGPPATVAIAGDRSVDQSSLAIEYELAPGGRWSGVAGVGWAAQGRGEGRAEEDVSFLLGGSYAARPGLSLRGSVARRIRFPTLRDLFAVDRGNPTLAPERTLDLELAVERELGAGGQALGVTLFRLDADDFIEGVPGGVLQNVQRTRFQGVEASGRHRWRPNGRLSWSYTRLDSENRSPGTGTAKTQNRPEHKASLVAERDTASGWRLRGEILFVADSYALSRGRPARAIELGDYTLVGGGVSVPLTRGRLRLTGRVGNLFDVDYVESIGFPGAGREIFLALELGPSPASASRP